MKVEEIAIRQEVRQMLQEAGYDREQMKKEVKKTVEESVYKAVKQCLNEMDIEGMIRSISSNLIHNNVNALMGKYIEYQVQNRFSNMKVTVEFVDENN